MFMKELILYVEYIRELVSNIYANDNKTVRSYAHFCNNLLEGIAYYQKLIATESAYFSDDLTVDQFESVKKDILQILEEVYKLSSANHEA